MRRISLGLFVGTFVFAMVMLARTTKALVPQLGVSLATILVVVSLVAYVVRVSHLRRSLRPVIVAARVGRQGRRALQRIYPAEQDAGSPPAAIEVAPARPPARAVRNPGAAGILVAFAAVGLVAEARRCDARIALIPAVGDFVRGDGVLFEVFESVMAIDQLHELLAFLAPRRLDLAHHRDHDGRVRFTAEMPRWEDYVSLAVDEIRALGKQQVQIVRRLRAMLEDLLQLAAAQRRDPLRHELDLLAQAVDRTFSDAEDRARASEADQQGIGSSPRPAARS